MFGLAPRRGLPRTVVVAVQKGGTGKTTLAASLSVAAAQSGERVAALDLDPQGSLAAWGAIRRGREPLVERVQPWETGQLAEILGDLGRQGRSVAFVDTAGASTGGIAAVLRLADLVLVPIRPSRLDLMAAQPTVQALAGDGLRSRLALVLNQCPPPPSPRTALYARQLHGLGVLAEPTLVQRVDHQDAMALGLGVTEHAPLGPASAEIHALWRWIDARVPPP